MTACGLRFRAGAYQVSPAQERGLRCYIRNMTRENLNGTFTDKYRVSVTITPEDDVFIKYPDGKIESWAKADSLWFIEKCLEWANAKGYRKVDDTVLDFRRIQL